ncbi:MAG: hypothetical protein ACFFE8_01020 [Candidatus Heimdallarchaeota archaeon]
MDHLDLIAILAIIFLWLWIYFPFFFSRPAGVDFSAHLFRLVFFQENGLNGEWNPSWYTGTPFLEQYPPNTTFLLWILGLFFASDQSYVIFLIIAHLIISLAVFFASTRLGKNKVSSLLGSLFVMTLPNLNTNFMFYSRAPTHIGIALLVIGLGFYYDNKRASTILLACLLGLTHFMMFGFFFVIVSLTELIYFFDRTKKGLKHNSDNPNPLQTSSEEKANNIDQNEPEQLWNVLKSELTRLIRRNSTWLIPFGWIFFLMIDFFQQPIGLILVSSRSLSVFTDGPGEIYWFLRVLRDIIYSYLSIFIFMFLALFALSLKSEKLNTNEMGLAIATFFIAFTGILMFYQETNAMLPLMLRGMDVLRFILITHILVVFIAVRGVRGWGSSVFLLIVLLLPLAEAQNGIVNYGYQDFDDNQWRDLVPVAEELKNRAGLYYACPKGYQGDHMAFLPILADKPYFDGWNPPGVRLNWFQNTPPSTQKYRPNSTLIADVIGNPQKYGVKWMIAGKNDYSLAGDWKKITTDDEQSKWLWETPENITLVDVYPSGNANLEYLSPDKISISVASNQSTVNLTIKVAHHPKWIVESHSGHQVDRESEVGFMEIKDIEPTTVILHFQNNHLKILFIAFIGNFGALTIAAFHDYNLFKKLKRFVGR